MSTELILYLAGGLLAVSAVAISFLGLRLQGFPGRLVPVIVLWFAILVGTTTTLAVVHAKHEQESKAAELSQGGEEPAAEDSH